MVFCCFLFFFFKQKTAYEIRLSLVGSEMCIRDRYSANEPVTVALTVKYDNAIQTSGASGGGVGTAIGRSVAAIASTTGAS